MRLLVFPCALWISGCIPSTSAVRPSFGEIEQPVIAKQQTTPKNKQSSTKQVVCIANSRASSSTQVEGQVGGRYVEGDPDSYVLSQASTPIISEATKYLGARYRSGATGPDAFDCSGYVWRVYSSVGIGLNRASSGDYFVKGAKIERSDAIPGDMIFFREHGRINHVGIYLGDDKFIHSSTALGVIESSMEDNYWKPRLAGFRRFES